MRPSRVPTALAALALSFPFTIGCEESPVTPADDDSATPDPEAPDLTEALAPGEARAGVVTDTAALFEGVSAEARAGDVKLYNACARYVVRAVRPGPYFVPGGGGITDADAVRPPGELGRDGLDDHFTFVGTGRLFVADTVEVVDDGTALGPAVVRATGHGEPMTLLLAAIGAWDFIPDHDFEVEQTYTLSGDSCAVRIDTTVRNAGTSAISLAVGDGAILSEDTLDPYLDEVGFEDGLPTTADFLGAVGRRNEGAMWLWPAEGSFDTTFASLMAGVGPVLVGLGETFTLGAGESASSTRYLGAAADPAVLEAERRATRGEPVATLAGVVTDGATPVAGARVHLVDAAGGHRGLAFTGSDGRYALVSSPGQYRVTATGDGNGEHTDVPAGWANHAPFALDEVNARAHGDPAAPAPPFADGYGASSTLDVTLDTAAAATADLALAPRGWITLRTVDEDGVDVPALVRVEFPDGVDPTPPAEGLEPGNPDGHERWIWTRGAGEVTVPVAPGAYRLVAHRGIKAEYGEGDVEVVAGETATATLTVPAAYEHPGWLTFDSHQHGSPSIDGGIPMEDRLAVAAATGMDLHIATDHDVIVDYRPVLQDLALDPWLGSVVAEECSPVLLGHYTIFPIAETVPDQRANGAVLWFVEPMTTSDLFTGMRERAGDDGAIVVAHGLSSSGMFNHASYQWHSGEADLPELMGDDYQGMEVIPGGDGFAWDEYLPVWYSLLRQGQRVAPIGASDSHSRRGGTPGYASTWVKVGVDTPDGLDPALLGRAVRAGEVVATTGPFVDLVATAGGASVGPGGHLSGDGIEISATVLAPSWVVVDEVRLLRDGEVVGAVPVDPGSVAPPLVGLFTFDDAPSADASYTVEVRGGSRDLSPVYPGRLPFAVTGPVWLDTSN